MVRKRPPASRQGAMGAEYASRDRNARERKRHRVQPDRQREGALLLPQGIIMKDSVKIGRAHV